MTKNKIKSFTIILITFILTLAVFLLSSCGYNKIMRKRLSNAENYYSCVLEIEEMNAYYPDRSEWFQKVECAADIDISDLRRIFLHCKVLAMDVAEFSEQSLRLEILKPNVEALLRTDFFNVVGIGDKISAKTSLWIYMDGEFNYIAKVQVSGKVYLQFEDGLQNIIDYMNANKGL